MDGVAERLKSIRSHLGETQKSMSSRLSLGESTWQNYERGLHFPGFEVLARLMEWGFSSEWIISGKGSMLIETASQKPGNALTDPELLAKINDAISRTYKDAGARINPADLGRMAAKWYDLVIQVAPDPAARAGALTVLSSQLKAELTAPIDAEESGKRRA